MYMALEPDGPVREDDDSTGKSSEKGKTDVPPIKGRRKKSALRKWGSCLVLGTTVCGGAGAAIASGFPVGKVFDEVKAMIESVVAQTAPDEEQSTGQGAVSEEIAIPGAEPEVEVEEDKIPNPWVKRSTPRPTGADVVAELTANNGACAMYTLTCDKEGAYVPDSGGFNWNGDCPEPFIVDWQARPEVAFKENYGNMKNPLDVCSETESADGQAITLTTYLYR